MSAANAVVPDDVRRTPDADEAQRAFAEDEMRATSSVVFSDASVTLTPPSQHFAEHLAYHGLEEKVMNAPVVYAVQDPSRGGAAHYLERSVYLVNARLDKFYRKYFEDMIDKYIHLRTETAFAVHVNPALLEIQLGDWGEDESVRHEIADTRRAEAVAARSRPFNPSEWVIYTRTSSAFFSQLGRTFFNDAMFDYSNFTVEMIGASGVSFHVVAFMCGAHDSFMRDNAVPAHHTDAEATILTLDTDVPAHLLAQLRRRYAATSTLPAQLAVSSDWIVLPAWTWTMRHNGMRDVANVRTLADVLHASQSLEAALMTALDRDMDANDALLAPTVSPDGCKNLALIKKQLESTLRFIGAVDAHAGA